MISNQSAPSAPVVPVLVYEDVAKMIGWLCGAFGFSERLRAGRPGGPVTHAQLKAGAGDVMIGLQGGPFKAPHPDQTSQYALVAVEDVDAHFARAKAFGAHIISPLENMPFGVRHYTARDPGGHWWTFAQNIADVAPQEWGAVVAEPRR
jgi:uncharacterized glyoxalase superfamily protein PhnB